ncbi:MAG: sensor histidine kinase [Bacteroidales bacterium]
MITKNKFAIIKKFDNKYIVSTSSLILIAIIGFIDYITAPELSFSFFYLIPISLISFYRETRLVSVILCSALASFLWFYADFNTRDYTNILFPFWNSFVRLVIFLSVGTLLFYLKEKNKKLKALGDEKNKFIGVAAHDLRTPIGGIYSFSDLLISNHKKTLVPEVHNIISLIRSMSDSALVLLQNLLDVSKIESGKIELKLANQDYIAFIKQQVLLNQIIAKPKNISIDLITNYNNIIINFDQHYLVEVINNLLSNAIKYSEKNSEIVVNISINDDKKVLTEVIDKGRGIPENEQLKLFRYFQTASTQPTDGEKSTGLGLAIAKQIITLHNGEINVKSKVNEGSNFYY